MGSLRRRDVNSRGKVQNVRRDSSRIFARKMYLYSFSRFHKSSIRQTDLLVE